jgi:hypothetical protein
MDKVANAAWVRKHDEPNKPFLAAETDYPGTLSDLIELCKNRPAGGRLKAAGSHWALSRAAISDHVFIETHAPDDSRPGLDRTLYDVVPKCLNPEFIKFMATRRPPVFGDPPSAFIDETFYLIHVEAGKRVYQLYSELDWGDFDDKRSLAYLLAQTHQNDAYQGAWAFRTLGGAGGQTVYGALNTGTHGGDFRFPPIADDVMAMHLVVDGGAHYWVEPAKPHYEMQLTNDQRLRDCYDHLLGFDIIRDDDIFNAILMSVGRFGIVYSLVLRAVRQYSLHEERRLSDWQTIREDIRKPGSGLYKNALNDPARPNRFLQIGVCLAPHNNLTLNRVGITKRWNDTPQPNANDANGRAERRGDRIDKPNEPTARFEFAGNSHGYSPDPDDPNGAAKPDMLTRACANGDFLAGIIEEACNEIEEFIENHTIKTGSGLDAVVDTGTGAGIMALAPFLAPILAFLLAYVAHMRASAGGQRFGQVLNEVREELLQPNAAPGQRAAGVLAWQLIFNKVFENEQKEHDYNAISYAVMDVHDYLDRSCYVNVDSIEVFFNATDSMLIAFVDAILAYEIRQEFEGKACVGYVSLRFTGPSRALIAPERHQLTCAVEVAALADVSGSRELVEYASTIARNNNYRGILHWGQRNDSTATEIEDRFRPTASRPSSDLKTWREALSRLTDGGRLDGFSSAFTRDVGLEVI